MNPEHAQRVYFEQLKRLVPITMVLAHYGIELRQQGQQLYGPCPIHRGNNKRQFTVKPATSEWHCFGDCKRGGAMLEFVAAMEHVETIDAARLVARWFAVDSSNHPSNQQQRRSSQMSDGSKPTHTVHSAQKRGEGEKDFLTRIGSAWAFNTKDGRSGLSIQLSALPIGDRMVIFEAAEDEHDGADKKEPAKSSFKKK